MIVANKNFASFDARTSHNEEFFRWQTDIHNRLEAVDKAAAVAGRTVATAAIMEAAVTASLRRATTVAAATRIATRVATTSAACNRRAIRTAARASTDARAMARRKA